MEVYLKKIHRGARGRDYPAVAVQVNDGVFMGRVGELKEGRRGGTSCPPCATGNERLAYLIAEDSLIG